MIQHVTPYLCINGDAGRIILTRFAGHGHLTMECRRYHRAVNAAHSERDWRCRTPCVMAIASLATVSASDLIV